ncbi:hypothetical protein [Ruminiclostridium cellobioparum]|uniref:hypothetical protein n=1 Tax=Ruminiclostridium cellobioparum TaxID=29355 RepID=UPI0028A73EEE|nr:hypothetical protein [Ruminiclostridium cellobioparum]
MKKFNRKVLIVALVVLIATMSSFGIYAATIDNSYKDYSKEIYDLYGKYSLNAKSFDENDPSTYLYPEQNANNKDLNKDRLKKGGTDISDFLDGSYFVYGSGSGNTRKRPSSLTYDKSKIGLSESQYIGEDSLGALFDNSAFPWNSWIIGGKALKDWDFVKRPWKDSILVNKYKLNEKGGVFLNSKIDLTENIKLGIYAKYIYFSAKETVVNLSADQKDKSIYYGKVIDEATRYDSFDYPDPTAFKTKGGSWKDYVYILSPPTTSTWGTGYMFHKYKNSDNQEVIDYITVPLAPFAMVKKLGMEQPKYSEDVSGCFLSVPKKEGNNMVAYIIRAPKFKVESPVLTKITVWLKQNLDESQQFDSQTNLGTKIFDGNIMFTPDKPYWIYKVTYPVPGKGKESGIYVKTGNHAGTVSNSTWYSSSGSIIGISHTTSAESDLVNWMPWDKIEADAQYKIKQQTK